MDAIFIQRAELDQMSSENSNIWVRQGFAHLAGFSIR